MEKIAGDNDEYFKVRDALFKVAQHPKVGSEVASAAIKYLRDKRTQHYLDLLSQDKNLETLTSEKTEKPVDIGMDLEELDALYISVPDLKNEGLLNPEQAKGLYEVIREQRALIINRPPTFLEKLKSVHKGKVAFWGVLGANSVPGGAGVVAGIIGNPKLQESLYQAQVYVYASEVALGVGGVVVAFGLWVFADVYYGLFPEKPEK